MYHSTNLLEAAMLMICLNMTEMLELSLLDDMDVELLDKLTHYYRSNLRCMSRRFLSKARSVDQRRYTKMKCLLYSLSHRVIELLFLMSFHFFSDGPSKEEISRVLFDSQQDVMSSASKRTRKRTRTSSNSSVESDIKNATASESASVC